MTNANDDTYDGSREDQAMNDTTPVDTATVFELLRGMARRSSAQRRQLRTLFLVIDREDQESSTASSVLSSAMKDDYWACWPGGVVEGARAAAREIRRLRGDDNPVAQEGATSTREKRASIQPTHDHAITGDRYHVTAEIDDRPVTFRQPIPDPFVRQTVNVGWRDLLRGLFRGGLKVTVLVGGDRDIQEDVLELDSNYLGPNCTRRDEFQAGLGKAVKRFAKEQEAADAERSL